LGQDTTAENRTQQEHMTLAEARAQFKQVWFPPQRKPHPSDASDARVFSRAVIPRSHMG
jgi:hypothetical protein